MLLLLLLQVLANCLWLGHGEVVEPKFSQSQCLQFFFNGTPPNDALTPGNASWICQSYENEYFFATLYNRTLRMPVYSAYLYNPQKHKRYDQWMVEPQLVNQSLTRDMKTEAYVKKYLNVTPDQLNKSQTVKDDYNNATGFQRGHLFPCSHTSSTKSCNSTFTLTNIVPQNQSLNQGDWKRYELTTMKNKTQGCSRTYVVTGIVPGNNSVNNRLNNPSHIWSSACCVMTSNTNKTNKAWGVIANNTKNQVRELTLGQLEKELTQLYKNGTVSLFGSECPR